MKIAPVKYTEQYLLNSLIDTIPDNIYFKDRESRFIKINNRQTKLFGLSDPLEALGKTDFDFFDEEHARPAFEDEQRIIATGEPVVGLEEKEVWPDGHITWVSTTKMPLRDETGKIIGIMGISRDITGRKRMEEALRLSETQFSTVFQASPIAISITRPVDGKIHDINQAFLRMFGYTREEVIGCTTLQLKVWAHPEKDRDQMLTLVREQGRVQDFEIKFRNKSGEIGDLLVSAEVINLEGDQYMLSLLQDITERKRVDNMLRESEERYRELFDNISSGVAIYDVCDNGKDFVFKDFNKAGERSDGNSREQLIGKSIYEMRPGIEEFGLLNVFRRVWKTGNPEHFPGKIYRDKVLEKWYKNFVYRLTTGEIVVVFDDISESKRAEETLIKERTLLRTLIDNLPNGVFVKDKEYRKIIVNPVHLKEVKNHLKYLGMNPEIDILGKTDFEIFPKEIAEKFITDDQKVVRDGSVLLNNEGLGYYEDGGQQCLLVSKIPLRDRNVEIIGMVGVTTDITIQRHAEEALKTSEEKFRTIFDNASDGMFLIDLETRKFIMHNTACSKMLGYSGDEFLNLDITAIHPSEVLPLVFERIEKVLKGEKVKRWDVKFIRKDGTVFTADLNPTLVTIGEKKLGLVVFRDITERLLIETELRAAKEKAEESDKLKTAFLHSIYHEIRTPLNGIIGFSDMITKPNLSPEKVKKFFHIIRDSSDQLLSSVNDIICIASIESGQEKLSEKESDINELLQLIKDQNSLKTETKNLSFTVSSALTDEEATVLVDNTKLLQILSNLVSNAIKYTVKGYIKVNCRLDGNFIKFAVEDTGIGISPEMHEKIFDRFYQIDHSDTQLYRGTGLGLAIVKSYVQLLNGEIHLDSKPGKGSVFIISIPFKPVKQLKRVNIPVRNELKPVVPATILIADDETVNFELFNEYLSDLSFTTIYAANGLQAVEACKNNPSIALVLMDAKMPLMDGYEAARQIKGFRPQLPIIIQTAYTLQNERENSILNFIDGFLEKPINQDKLLETLRKNLI